MISKQTQWTFVLLRQDKYVTDYVPTYCSFNECGLWIRIKYDEIAKMRKRDY